MKETNTLELKENISNTFLKTVSAYANYGDGEIKFGIRDDGAIVGIDNPQQACLDIENRINDSIDPNPDYILEVDEATRVITLRVREGVHKPYLYKAKAYKRNDSATIEAGRLELTRLILTGQNKDFEELAARQQDCSFNILEEKLRKAIQIDRLTRDILKTLELYRNDIGLNNAGELLADENSFPGVDVIRFGDSINIILDRECYEHISVLQQYEETLLLYRKYYQYEQITGAIRKRVEKVPEEAFREALANALAHRLWDIRANIRVSMYDDYIEIVSPGGLPAEISSEEYLRGQLSVLRNPILGNVLFRLGIIERIGSGVKRIAAAYQDSIVKPEFSFTANTISVKLPVIEAIGELKPDERLVYRTIKGKTIAAAEIASITGFSKTKLNRILKKLLQDNYIKVSGQGRGTKYMDGSII